MIKHYSSDSNIAVNVVLSSGKSTHIAFVPLSSGGSTFSTNIEDIQKALENHYRFNSLFKIDRVEDENAPKTTPQQETSTEEATISSNSLRKITVHDEGEAKDYLADVLGVSRTKLRSSKAIVDAATANGIEFEGL